MDPAHVALLVFLLLAVATVAISVLVQQYLSSEPKDPRDTERVNELRAPEPDDDIGGPLSHADAGSLTRGADYRRARAEELEAVARRERQHADRAEAAARRLREWDDEAGPAPSEQRARRRRAAARPEDFAY
ncbi:MAG TPA: hypothetical protein VFZ37_09770 [Jiangellaceae bacterium]